MDDRVNEALSSIVLDALSGRPASAVKLDDDVNDALGLMVCEVLSGRPISEVLWSFLMGEKAPRDAGAKKIKEPPVSDVGTDTADNEQSRRVAYDKYVRAASEVHVDWSKVSCRTVYISRSRYGR